MLLTDSLETGVPWLLQGTLKIIAGFFYDTHGNQYAGHFSGIKKDSDQTAQKVRYKDRSEKRTEKSTSSACLKYLSSVAVIFLPCFMRSCLRAYIAFIILTIFT